MIRLFISYSHKDEEFRQELETHLALLKRQNVIDVWQDRKITAGCEWANTIDKNLEAADIVLLLISADFLASDYCYDIEMKRALEKHNANQVKVIPIIIRAVDWGGAKFGKLNALPKDGKPVDSWGKKDEAWTNVAQGIRRTIEEVKGQLTKDKLLSGSEKTVRPWNVPFDHNVFFTGREDVLTKIREALQSSGKAALSGLGGIGKTQTAVEFAHRYSENYTAILWVKADSREAIVSGFAELAGVLNLSDKDVQDQNVVIESVKQWFNNNQNWLLILDNADDLKLVTDFLPKGKKGHVILTTRAQATGKIAKRIEIGKLELNAGAGFLLRRAKIIGEQSSLTDSSDIDQAVAKQITQKMGGLPLALDQAGAYIEETGMGLVDYFEMYKTHGLKLLKERGGILTDHPDSVVTTWLLSFEKIEQASPCAAEILQFLAFLHPDTIPEEFLVDVAKKLGPTLEPVLGDLYELNQAISEILKYSLIRRDPKAKTLQIHRLVQAVIKNGIDDVKQKWLSEKVVLATNHAFPLVEFSTWPQCERLILQAQNCRELIEQRNIEIPDAARLLTRAGEYLKGRALYVESNVFLRKALSLSKRIWGLDHQHVADSLNGLAELYYVRGDYRKAESFYLQALEIRKRGLGVAHPDVASTLNNLGLLYKTQGKYKEAEPLYKRALRIRKRALGIDHPDVGQSMNNVGMLYSEQSKFGSAKRRFQRALEILESKHGMGHPDVAIIVNNLALLYHKQKRYDVAEPLYRRAMGLWECTLGNDHPDVATCLSNLALLYDEQGEYDKAKPFYQQALRISRQALGLKHPHTIQTEKDYDGCLKRINKRKKKF